MKNEGDRLRESMLEYLDGAVPPEELERLNRAVLNDPAARRDLAELMLQEILLARIGQESRVFELDDEPGPRKASGHATSRILQIRRNQGPARRLWAAATIAAAALFAITVLMAVRGLQPSAPRSETAPVVVGEAPAPPTRAASEPPRIAEAKPKPAPAPVAAPRPIKPAPRKPKPADPRKDLPGAPAPLIPDEVMAVPPPDKLPPVPLPAPRVPAEPTVKYWETVIARIERVQSEVVLVATGGLRKPVKDGQNFLWGQALETMALASSAALVFPDGTQVEIGPQTALWEMSDRPGARGEIPNKRLFVTAGTVTAEVAAQAAGCPMVLTTPHAEAKILGARIKLVVEPDATKIEVLEGKIQASRKGNPAAVDIGAGFSIVVGAGLPLEARPKE